MITFLYAIVALLCTVVFLIYWKVVRPQKQIYDALRSQGLPGDSYIPFLGQSLESRRAVAKTSWLVYREELSKKYGHVYVSFYGPFTVLIVNEPDMIADILSRSHAEDYIKPAAIATVFKPLIGSHNIVATEGLEHERARKMLNPAFYFENIQSMTSIMIEKTAKGIDELLASSSIDQQTVDLKSKLHPLTLSIIMSCAFGQHSESSGNTEKIISKTFTEVTDAIQYRMNHMISQTPIISKLPFWQKPIVDRGCKKIAEYVDQIIEARRDGKSKSICSGSDILDLLLSAVDDQGRSFSDQEVKDEALAFVLAGHETVGNLLIWLVYVLMTNEKVLRDCQNEVDKILPDGIELTSEHISQLHVCEAVIYETLRLYPPAPFIPRQSIREHVIGSKDRRQLRIPAKTIIGLNSYTLHRHEEFWPRPLEFDYTRWMRDPATGLKRKLAHPYCYLPFAAGSRNCIGQNFALLEAKVVLSMLVQRCNFELEPGQTIIPDIRINMRPKYGLKARISKRL